MNAKTNLRILTVTIDRADGSNLDEVIPLINEVLTALEPLKDRVRFRVTRSPNTLTEDKAYRPKKKGPPPLFVNPDGTLNEVV
jgi:hypothetical protein